MKRLSYFIIGGVVLGWWTCAVSAQTLTIGTAEWRPWQIVEDGHLTGITSDILQEIAKRTGYTMNIRPLPHKRLMSEFEMGKVDMEPTVNPAWRDFQKDISVYSTPYYATGDII